MAYASWIRELALVWYRGGEGFEETYDGYFAAELVLDLTFFVGIGAFLLNDGEELFDTHLCGVLFCLMRCCGSDCKLGFWWSWLTRS